MSNDQIIYDVARRDGFNPVAAKLIAAQARYESADYTSSVFRNNLNTSGMKYIGQPLATRGTLAPASERSDSCNTRSVCLNRDYYAKYRSVADSAKDKIQRNFNLTINGVTPQQLRNAKTAEEFADLLKKRGYYGITSFVYAAGLKAKMRKVNVSEKEPEKKSTDVFPYLLLLAGMAGYGYYYYNRFVKKK